MAVYIYALLDPRTMRPRYIGKTQRLEYRLYQHMRATRRSRKGNWLADLRELGLKPLMTILEEVPPEKSWEEAEIRWIAFYRATDDLCNETEGGDGGKVSLAIRREISKRMLGNKCHLGMKVSIEGRERMRRAALNRSPEAREKQRLSRQHVSQETREKNRQAALNCSAETREKMRQAKLGKPLSIEHRRKLGLASRGNKHGLGYHHSLEAKERIRQASLRYWRKIPASARLGKKHSAETIEKIRLTWLGRRHTPEAIEKMRQAALVREKKKALQRRAAPSIVPVAVLPV